VVNIKTGLTNNMRIKTILILGFLFLGCGTKANHSVPDITSQVPDSFFSEKDSPSETYASPTDLDAFKESRNKIYLLGSGDIIEIEMEPNQEEINGEYKLSPYGTISIYLGGELNLGGLTLRQAEGEIKNSLAKYYDIFALNLKIKSYSNNKVFVLGRVESPGAVELTGNGTILEVLSQAGPLPPVAQAAYLTRCAIIRGSDQIIWIDLQELLQKGNVKLNLPLNNNDILYIPDPEDTNIFVMGEVEEPGSYPIKNELSLLSAIGMAGGPTEDAVTSNVQLIRDRGLGGGALKINLDEMMQHADLSQNYMLKRNDIIFLPKKGAAKFNYYLRQISPLVDIIFLGNILFP